jgi:hypothetical protein
MSGFAYFCRHKSRSHQLAKRAANRNLTLTNAADARHPVSIGDETAFDVFKLRPMPGIDPNQNP